MRTAAQELPAEAGIGLANWNWRAVRRFVRERFGLSLCRSSCLNWLRRLGFAFKRPKKRLVKADEARREAFVVEYTAILEEAIRTGGKVFFADEAHFRADAELRGKWVLKGEPALVDSSSPAIRTLAYLYTIPVQDAFDGIRNCPHCRKDPGDRTCRPGTTPGNGCGSCTVKLGRSPRK